MAGILWFLIFICLFCFFSYGKNCRVFQAILFYIMSKIFNLSFWSGTGVFLLLYSGYLAKTHNRISSTLVLISRFYKTSIRFPFFVVFFLFVLIFLEDIVSKIVAARQMYTKKFHLFLYMKSIACHIYHTSLKIPWMIFYILRLFDFPCWIWLSLGIQKSGLSFS